MVSPNGEVAEVMTLLWRATLFRRRAENLTVIGDQRAQRAHSLAAAAHVSLKRVKDILHSSTMASLKALCPLFCQGNDSVVFQYLGRIAQCLLDVFLGEWIVNNPPMRAVRHAHGPEPVEGLRLRPCGLSLRISRSAELTTKPGLHLSKVREHRVETRKSATRAIAGGYERSRSLRE